MAVDRERRHQKHRQKIMKEYQGICHLCGDPYADSIDHVVPVAIGGSDHPDNLRPAHTSCNSSKGARSYPKWAEEKASMWMPGYEPEAVKRQKREAAAARKLRKEKAAALRRKQVEEHKIALAAWEEDADRRKQIANKRRKLLAEQPMPPPSDSEMGGWLSFLAVVIGFVVPALAIMWWTDLWPLGQRNWELVDVGTVILVGAVVYWVAVSVLKFLRRLFIHLLKPTFFEDRRRKYEEDEAKWQKQMDDFDSEFPIEPKPQLPWEDEKSKPRSSTPRVYPKSRRRYRSRGYYRGYRRF